MGAARHPAHTSAPSVYQAGALGGAGWAQGLRGCRGVGDADVQTCAGAEHLRGGDVGEGLRRRPERGARGGGGGQVALARRHATARLEESRAHPRFHSTELRPLARAESLLRRGGGQGWRAQVGAE